MKIYYTLKEIEDLKKYLKCVICGSYYELDRDYDMNKNNYEVSSPYHLNCRNRCASINFWFVPKKEKHMLS